MLAIVRRLLAFGVVAVAVIALLAIVVDSPALSSDDVAASITHELRVQGGTATCREQDGERWRCELPGGAVYEVTGRGRCWDARLQRGDAAWPEASSCVL